MAIIRITKAFNFEMAHALLGYEGPCKHIHGHSYELFVTVKGKPIMNSESSENGMLMDFGVLKNLIKINIIDQFDHSLVINKDASAEFVAKSHDMFSKLHLVPYQPTIENLLEDFANRIKVLLPKEIQLFRLMLRETVTSYAEWFAEDNK
ncbi:MAG: 6-carboxytetrahydropterin synthase [Bacteroidota bacterium]